MTIDTVEENVVIPELDNDLYIEPDRNFEIIIPKDYQSASFWIKKV